LIPSLLNSSHTSQPLDAGALRYPLPPLSFNGGPEADIKLIPVTEGEIPGVKGNKRVRRIGTMHFAPFVSADQLRAGLKVDRFDDLAGIPVVQMSGYSYIKSLNDWNGVCSLNKDVTVFSSTREMHRALFKGNCAGLFPTYSTMYEANSRMIEIPSPRLAASLWLVSEEDSLRDPGVRQVYDGIADMFSASPWFA
jgi:DNA-binding transcriptional LysR family regulator